MNDGSASVAGGGIGTGQVLKVSGEPQSVDLGNGVVALVKPLRRSATNAVMAAAGIGEGNDGASLLLMEYAFRAAVQSVSVNGAPIKLKHENHPTIGKVITRDTYDDIIEAAGETNEAVATGGIVALARLQQSETTAGN